MKVTRVMVKDWLGSDDPAKILREIANSKNDSNPWTPQMLHNDIVETYKQNIKNIKKGSK